MTLTVGSLFAGIGGFDLGFERAGMKVVWASEADKFASKTFAKNFPSTPNLGDIHDVESPAPVDVLVGGFPCQSYSVAGRRGGLADDRGELWWQFHRLIGVLQPRWVVGENVPGLLSSHRGKDFAAIIGSLVEHGYGVTWAVLDSQWFGVAQRRRRLFVVGHSGGVPRPEVLALSESLSGHPQPERPSRSATSTQVAFGPGGGDLARSLTASTGGMSAKEQQATFVASGFDWMQGDAQPLLEASPTLRSGMNMGPAVQVDPDPAPTLRYSTHKGPAYEAGHDSLVFTEPDMVPFAQNSRNELRVVGQGDVTGALTHSRGSKQTTFLAGPAMVRRLTPVECERLQGFPDGWTEGVSDTQRYKQLGNAVTVNVAEWIGRRIVASERNTQ